MWPPCKDQVCVVLGILLSWCLPLSHSVKASKDLQIIPQFKPDVCSEFAETGDHVLVHYTGSLQSGEVFDSSLERDPLRFTLGEGKVIQGWEKGIQGMCPGEKRRLIIPPHLGYGKNGYPPLIPGDATLIFETELMSLQKRAVEDVVLPTLRFLAIPTAVVVLIYYLYSKYKEVPSKRELREERRSKRKRR